MTPFLPSEINIKRVVANKPGGLAVAPHNGGLLKETRDDMTAAATADEDEDDELRPRAKFSNGITTYTTLLLSSNNFGQVLNSTLSENNNKNENHRVDRLGAEKTELDINVEKWAILCFSAASSKFRSKWRIPQRGVKICMPQNTAVHANHQSSLHSTNTET